MSSTTKGLTMLIIITPLEWILIYFVGGILLGIVFYRLSRAIYRAIVWARERFASARPLNDIALDDADGEDPGEKALD